MTYSSRPVLQVKVALMHYMLELCAIMEMKEFSNTSDTRLAVSRIITWTTEPKSHEVRKVRVHLSNFATAYSSARSIVLTFRYG